MSDEYFISKEAKKHILKSWSINPLTRSIKSKKNGFTYEHVIPSSFVTKEILKNPSKDNIRVVIGRDARISGKMISSLVANTLVGLGIDVIDLGDKRPMFTKTKGD